MLRSGRRRAPGESASSVDPPGSAGHFADEVRSLTQIRILIGIVILGLVASGISALPLEAESRFLSQLLQRTGWFPGLAAFMTTIHRGLQETYRHYPFLAYGTDWLAFGHFVIAIFFIGPWLEPRRNLWVLDAGMIACLLVIPTALICGGLRQLPLWWRLVDCAFGVFGLIPLWLARHLALRLPDSKTR